MERALKLIGTMLGIVVTAGTLGAVVARSVAAAEVAPIANGLTKHIAETKDDQGDIKRIEEKVDLLIEDCYRRGGCRRN